MPSAFRPAFRPLALALLALASCQQAPAPGEARVDLRHTSQPGGTPVARWQGDAVTAEELERRLREMSPALRERYQAPEARREYVEDMARFELLVREALERGLHQDPEVVAIMKRALVNRLVREQWEEVPVTVSDAEVAEAYTRAQGDFVRPAQVRLSHIFLAAPRGEPARVAAARREAEEVLARAKALPALDFGGFGQLAREASEEPRTQPLEGDMRFLSDEALARTYGPEVAEAARGLGDSGALSGVVQTEAGLHILKLRGRQAALNLGLEEAKSHIVARLTQEKRNRAWADFLAGLSRRLELSVDDVALAKGVVDMSAPMQKPSGPLPGTVPPPTPSARGTQP
jgi:peptidyl-prolyl cis-trans isomerase C